MNKESKYEYLKEYINRDINIPGNFFGSVKASDIILSEKRVCFAFPDALKEFWLDIGYGFFMKRWMVE